MRQMTNGRIDEEDSIYSVPADRCRQEQFRPNHRPRSPAHLKKSSRTIFPAKFDLFRNQNGVKGYQRYWKYKTEYMDLYDEFEEQVIERFKTISASCHQTEEEHAQKAVWSRL